MYIPDKCHGWFCLHAGNVQLLDAVRDKLRSFLKKRKIDHPADINDNKEGKDRSVDNQEGN